MVEPGLGRRAARLFTAARATASALFSNRTAALQRGVVIHCEQCQQATLAPQTTRISRRGLWVGDPCAPTGWSIRYERREGQDALATYYCAGCAAKMANGKTNPKV